jgi:hypothetical protein
MALGSKPVRFNFPDKALETDLNPPAAEDLQETYEAGGAGSQQIQLNAIQSSIEVLDVAGAGDGLTIPVLRVFDELGAPVLGVAGLQSNTPGMAGKGVFGSKLATFDPGNHNKTFIDGATAKQTLSSDSQLGWWNQTDLAVAGAVDFVFKRVNPGGVFATPILEADMPDPSSGGAMTQTFGVGRFVGSGQPILWLGDRTGGAFSSMFIGGLLSNGAQGVRLLDGAVSGGANVKTFQAQQFISNDYYADYQNGHFVYFWDAEDPPNFGDRQVHNYRGVITWTQGEEGDLTVANDVAVTKMTGWTGAPGSGTPVNGNLTVAAKVGGAGAYVDCFRVFPSATANDTAMMLVTNIGGVQTLKRVVRDAITGVLSAP